MKSEIDLARELLPQKEKELFDRWLKIKQEVNNIKRKMGQCRESYEEQLKELNIKMVEIWKSCKHEKTKHYGDPAGGFDSFDECEICGLQQKDIPWAGYDG
jgi:hypothetical protein